MPEFAADKIGGEDYQIVKIGVGPPGTSVEASQASPLPTRDPCLEISRGNLTGHSTVVIRGHNPSQTSASGFVDIAEFGDLTHLTSAETMDIVSASTDDDGSPVGIGLRTLLVLGVDNTGADISEVITLNGTTDVTTVNSYLRVNTLVGLTVGSAGWNVGDITCIASSAATIQSQMGATEGISQSSHYTVPLGKTLHVTKLEFNAAKLSGGQLPVVEFKVYVRSGGDGNCWIQLFDKKMDSAVSNELDLLLPFPSSATQAIARTDFRIRADTDQDNTEVRTRMYGILIDD